MRGRRWAAFTAAVALFFGTAAVAIAQTSGPEPVNCSYDGSTLSCPLPQQTITETATASTTATVTADPITVFTTATATTTVNPPTVTAPASTVTVTKTTTKTVTAAASTKPATSNPTSTSTAPTTPASTTSATPAAGLNCAPTPSACGYPDATNTGVPAGTVLRTVPGQVTSGTGWHWDSRGWVEIDGDGAVFSGYSMTTGNIDVTGANVTISNNQLTLQGDKWAIGLRAALNATITRNTITSPAMTGPNRLQEGIRDIGGDSNGVQIIGNDISHADSAINHFDTGGLIKDNYLHDFGYNTGDHVNGIQLGSGTGPLMTIRHNTIFNQIDQTDCVMLATDDGPQTNRLIDNNLLAGGGYTFYGAGGPNDAPTYIRFTNNRLSKIFYPMSGYFGAVAYFNKAGTGNVFSGNVWDADGSAVTG